MSVSLFIVFYTHTQVLPLLDRSRGVWVCVCVGVGPSPGRRAKRGCRKKKPVERGWWSSGLGLLRVLVLAGSGLVDGLPLFFCVLI